MTEKRVCIGKISAAHGVKGLVKVLPYCEDLSLLNGTLFTGEKGDKTLDVAIKSNSGKYLLAAVEGIHNKEDADKLKDKLYIDRSTLPDLDDDDSVYIHDLLGLNALDENEEKLGKVKAVQNFGAGDLLEIQPSLGQSYFIPFQDEFIISLDLEAQSITLKGAEQFQID